MKAIYTTYLFCLIFFNLPAQVTVSTQSELENALMNAQPGSTIILSNGIWKDAEINLNAFADASNPIIIKAERAGQVFFEGNSKIKIGGSYIHIEGIVFTNPSGLVSNNNRIDPIIKFKSAAECNHCRITNIKIENYNGSLAQESDTFHWIQVNGQYNEISHSSFTGKKGIGKIITVIVDSLSPNFAEIHHNYFADRTPVNDIINAKNGQEAITIGASTTSLSSSNSKIYDNFFHNWAGEIEIVSNKSGENQYYNNTFRNYSGTLTLRHGNNCEVYNNYFFAENNLLSGGIRVIGEGHKVFNNYIEEINSTKPDGAQSKATGGINISNGKPDSALDEYYQVKNTTIVNNTCVNCDYGIQVGTKLKDFLTLPPEDLIIANNIMLNSSKKAIREVTSPSGSTSSYTGNITQNGTWDINTGSNQTVNSDLLVPDTEFYRLPSNSPAINAGIGVYPFLNHDILYGNRPAGYDAGCEEYGGSGMSNFPYSTDDIGVHIGFKANSLPDQTVNYTASTHIIPNPERGLQKYSITGSNYYSTPGANNLSVSTLNNWKNSNDKVRVVFRYFLLDDFMNSNINSTYLNNIQKDFDNIRTAGLKVIVRFSYSDAQGTGAQQASKSQILSHISQLAPLLNTNKDVIFSHQAGFIGTWGEWYYTNSSEFGTEDNISSTQWANRKEILDAMLSATPVEIPLQVRYAGIKTRLYGASQLTAQSAYQNTTNARIGFYNDAFLNNWGDQGTYSVNNQCQNPVGNSEYNYLSNETQYLPMTGETNGLNPCNSGFRTTGTNAIYEMGLTNWTTLNRDYHGDFWNQIIASNHYDEILRKLGYRFVLNSSTVTSNGLDFDLSINLDNIGFARAFKERDVYLVMKNVQNNAVTTHLINTDIRTWENSVSINQNINPGISGTFQLYLWMPDKAPSLATNPDYSIQFANENIWETATGYNDLMQTVSLNCTPSTGTDTRTECNSFTWIDGNTYTSSNNSATHNLNDANGCDSIVTLNLTILKSSTGTDTRTECDSYTWIDGNTYTSSNNTATHNLTGANGCDSIVTLNLTILNSSTGTDTRTECDAFTWLDGNTYTANNNTATHNLTNANGCDSIVTLNLTILNSSTGTDTRTECNAFTWIDGNTYTSSNNLATHNLTGANGCDSIVTLNLTILNSSTGTDTRTECDAFTWLDGNTYTSSNNSANHNLTGANGCDSIITLNLTILSSSTGTDTRTECDAFTWLDGNTYTSSNNSATHNLTGVNGCDSIVTLNLTILNSSTGTDTRTECDSYTWIDGNTYTANNNSATHNLTGANGCDSIVTLNLTILNSLTGTDTHTECDSFTWIDGNIYTSSNNTATHNLTNANGCDSIVTLNLTILNSSTGTDTQTECDAFTWIDGNTYTSSNNSATHNLTSANGCDSIVTLNLTILNSLTGTDTHTECDSFTWINGNIYTSSNNTATHNLTNANGCDSIVTLNLTILNSSTGTDTQTECDAFTWIDGNTYTSSNNSATHNLIGANGCDSIVTLNLTITNSTTGTETRTECNAFTWIDGNTYTSSNNSATHNLTAANGCDSIVTLDLIINNVSDITTTISGTTITANNSGALYQWLNCADGFSIINGATDISFTPEINGEYAVELTENSCQDTSACVSITSVGITEIDLSGQFFIFPNPVREQIFIQNPKKTHGIIQIFDSSGKLLFREELNDFLTSVKTDKINQGAFFIRIISDKDSMTKKFVKL